MLRGIGDDWRELWRRWRRSLSCDAWKPPETLVFFTKSPLLTTPYRQIKASGFNLGHPGDSGAIPSCLPHGSSGKDISLAPRFCFNAYSFHSERRFSVFPNLEKVKSAEGLSPSFQKFIIANFWVTRKKRLSPLVKLLLFWSKTGHKTEIGRSQLFWGVAHE